MANNSDSVTRYLYACPLICEVTLRTQKFDLSLLLEIFRKIHTLFVDLFRSQIKRL